MATQEKTWNVANRLHSLKDSDNPEVNHIIAGADEIYDDAKGAKQSDINAQADAALADRYTKAETYSKEQLDALITTPDVNYVTVATFADLPQTGEANTIYRVSSYDGTQVDASKYALYAWNGTVYQLLAVRSAVGEVFDVSEYNSGATYETLTAALAAVPASAQRGGMSIKFILRTNTGTEEYPVYHDEYVQYRLMNTAWSSVVSDWQGVDNELTAGSRNLVESGVVQNELALGAVYDVSAKNPTAGPNNDGKFESLSALLSDANLNTLIPTAVRKGGMSIKFVQSSDNKYVQFRLMSDTFSTTESDWQGVDDEPTAGSDNLVKSGGVYEHTKWIERSEVLGSLTESFEVRKDNDEKVVEVTNEGVSVNGTLTLNNKVVVTEEELNEGLDTKQDIIEEIGFDTEKNAVSRISIYDDDDEEVSSISIGEPVLGEESQKWTNDEGTDEYARIDPNGVTAKGFYKTNGVPVGNIADTIVVDPSGRGDYTNIVDALNNAGDTATRHVTIIINQGTYEMPPKVSNVAPYEETYRNVTLRGVNREKCVLSCDIGFYDYTIGTDCSTLRISGNVTIENLTIISSNEEYDSKIGTPGYVTERTNRKAAYCIHLDNSRRDGDVIVIRNCTLIDYQMSAIGFGTRKDSVIRVEDCYVQCEQAVSESLANSYGVLYGHNGSNSNVGGQRFEAFRNQIVHKTGNIAVQYLYTEVSPSTNLECSMCLIGNACKTQNIENALSIGNFPEGTFTLDDLSFGNQCAAMNVNY